MSNFHQLQKRSSCRGIFRDFLERVFKFFASDRELFYSQVFLIFWTSCKLLCNLWPDDEVKFSPDVAIWNNFTEVRCSKIAATRAKRLQLALFKTNKLASRWGKKRLFAFRNLKTRSNVRLWRLSSLDWWMRCLFWRSRCRLFHWSHLFSHQLFVHFCQRCNWFASTGI